MNDSSAQHASPAIRASDADREQTIALLQQNFADGRLTKTELEERTGAACTAQSQAELHDLIADLLATPAPPPRSGIVLDQRLLIILLCVHPPAALVYWLVCRRRRSTTGLWPVPTPSTEKGCTAVRRMT